MSQSEKLFSEAVKYIPGGVNSPVRACKSVGVDPLFIDSADKGRIETVDGQELVDMVLSWGPMILGHNHPYVTESIHAAVDFGCSFGAPCRDEVDLAKIIVDDMPSVDMVRMVNSGTEATMSALRLARGVTGRAKVIKFIGGYHGHNDAFLASAGSGLATLSIPGTPGVPAETVAHTLLAPYNDIDAVADLFEKHGEDIAAVIVEPMAGNMGCVPPAEGFLQGLRDLSDKYEALLIFDEVITGFRLSLGGAQMRFGIKPDLTCLGKIIGGGMPVGAYGGRADLMQRIAPCGEVYQAGTLAGNPVAMAAGLATLRQLGKQDYDALETRTKKLADDLTGVLREKGLPVTCNQIASVFTLFFTDEPVTDFASASKGDCDLYSKYFRHMRDNGVFLAPSAFECTFASFAHTEEDLDRVLEAARSFQP
jgi:glutamate-1-semialdehyde 2,1-aminomutase